MLIVRAAYRNEKAAAVLHDSGRERAAAKDALKILHDRMSHSQRWGLRGASTNPVTVKYMSVQDELGLGQLAATLGALRTVFVETLPVHDHHGALA